MSQSARISLPVPDTMSPDQRAVFDKIISGPRGVLVGPLRAALHSPPLADSWQQLGRVLRFETSLPAHLNELAILLTARRWNCELEWAIHEADALRLGMSADWTEAIRTGRAPPFAADLAAAEVYEYCRQILLRGDAEQDVYDAIVERWGEVGVVELTAVIGYYSMVAMTLNAHRIPLPQGVTCHLPGPRERLFESPALIMAQSDHG